jgi:hypothetical protein
MEESPSAPVPPKEAAASDEKAAQEEKPRRERRRFHVPTSVLVTVLVAGVSVWVAPALTRQWDDRQKARELRVASAESVIAKGTQVIYAATRPPLPGYKPAADYDALVAQWYEDSAVVKAKLRAYFPTDISDRWDRFDDNFVYPLLEIAKRLPAAQKRHAGETHDQLTDRFKGLINVPLNESDLADARLVQYVMNISLASFKEIAPGTTVARLDSWIDSLADAVETPPAENNYFVFLEQAAATSNLEVLTDHLLSAHMTGFSTTRRDFLRDLLP